MPGESLEYHTPKGFFGVCASACVKAECSHIKERMCRIAPVFSVRRRIEECDEFVDFV
jgi:hypothetical protein